MKLLAIHAITFAGMMIRPGEEIDHDGSPESLDHLIRSKAVHFVEDADREGYEAGTVTLADSDGQGMHTRPRSDFEVVKRGASDAADYLEVQQKLEETTMALRAAEEKLALVDPAENERATGLVAELERLRAYELLANAEIEKLKADLKAAKAAAAKAKAAK